MCSTRLAFLGDESCPDDGDSGDSFGENSISFTVFKSSLNIG
jgi:hypothetical protein